MGARGQGGTAAKRVAVSGWRLGRDRGGLLAWGNCCEAGAAEQRGDMLAGWHAAKQCDQSKGDRMIGWGFNARSITSGFRSPFERMRRGRAKHPCLAAADQGWSALPDTSGCDVIASLPRHLPPGAATRHPKRDAAPNKKDGSESRPYHPPILYTRYSAPRGFAALRSSRATRACGVRARASRSRRHHR
jgi:hypothetical protein